MEQSKPTVLEVGEEVLLETNLAQQPVLVRGRLSSVLPDTLWVNTAEFAFHPLVHEIPNGHRLRFSAYKSHNALVGDSTFQRILGIRRRLVAVEPPAELHLVDRRASLRVPIRQPVAVCVARESLAGDAGIAGMGASWDISLTGIKLETSLHLSIGDHVFVTTHVCSGKPIYALAQVVRLEDAPKDRAPGQVPEVSPWGEGRRRVVAGLKFSAMSEADHHRLVAFVGKAAAVLVGSSGQGEFRPCPD